MLKNLLNPEPVVLIFPSSKLVLLHFSQLYSRWLEESCVFSKILSLYIFYKCPSCFWLRCPFRPSWIIEYSVDWLQQVLLSSCPYAPHARHRTLNTNTEQTLQIGELRFRCIPDKSWMERRNTEIVSCHGIYRAFLPKSLLSDLRSPSGHYFVECVQVCPWMWSNF